MRQSQKNWVYVASNLNQTEFDLYQGTNHSQNTYFPQQEPFVISPKYKKEACQPNGSNAQVHLPTSDKKNPKISLRQVPKIEHQANPGANYEVNLPRFTPELNKKTN